MSSHSELVKQRILTLKQIQKHLLQIGEEMFAADSGNVFGVDFLALGAMNRAVAHCAGFQVLIESKNLICAGSLLRLQIDTAIRFYAAFIVKKPHEFAEQVMAGQEIRKLCDSSGQKMTDRYLVDKLACEAPWLPNVYKETSGYIHLSSKHILSAMVPGEKFEQGIELKVSAIDKELPDSIYIEAIDAFTAASELLIRYLEGWVYTKQNPEIIEERRMRQVESSDETKTIRNKKS